MALWVLHMRELRYDAELVRKVTEEGVVAIGWSDVPNLIRLRTREAILNALRETYASDTPAMRLSVHAGIIYRFLHEVQPGDLVLVPLKVDDTIKIGRFTADPPFRDDNFHDDYVHCRRVEWLKDVRRRDFTQDALYSIGSALTLSQPSTATEEQVRRLLEGKTPVSKGAADTASDEEDTLAVLIEQLAELRETFIAERIRQHKGHDYQIIVAGVLEALGYRVKIGPRGPDRKSDIIAHPDELGLQDPKIRVEVKSSDGAVGVDEVRALAGALQENERGLFVSRMGFTREAEVFAATKPRLSLMTGEQLVELILEHYERLPDRVRAWIPLRRVWIPDQ